MKMIETWIIYAFVGFIGYFMVNFLMKYVANENPLMVSLILYSAAAITMFAIIMYGGDFSIQWKSIGIAVVMGLFSVAATIFAIKSVGLAPNPGYSVAIFSSNFVLLTIVSVFAFGSKLTLQKGVGIVATLIGLVLISI